MKPQTEKKCRDYMSGERDKNLLFFGQEAPGEGCSSLTRLTRHFSDAGSAEVLSPGCVFGVGLPNGSLELPDFPNGSPELPDFPQIRLTKSHASDISSETLNRDCRASCGR